MEPHGATTELDSNCRQVSFKKPLRKRRMKSSKPPRIRYGDTTEPPQSRNGAIMKSKRSRFEALKSVFALVINISDFALVITISVSR